MLENPALSLNNKYMVLLKQKKPAMSFWSSFPFFRYLIWLTAGIMSAFNLPELPSYSIILLALSLLYTLFYFRGRNMAAYRRWQGLLAFLIVFLFGYGSVQEHATVFPPEPALAGKNMWLVEARQDAEHRPKSLKLQARVLALRRDGAWHEQEGEVMLYIRQEGMQAVPQYGDRLMVHAQLRPIPEPLNPREFNYKDYLASQGICCQAFVGAEQVALMPYRDPLSLAGMAMQVRRWASSQVRNFIEGRQEAAIVNALVLGYRETLDQEIIQAYATAGAMHILAVSGLHVGFIYLFMKLLLRPWRRRPSFAYAGFVLTLMILWSYAFITGLSPSVLRAVAMFSLLDLALLLKRKTGIYNTLAVAAFFMLLYNPFMLKMVGFQLSFLSLLGIVYLQPRLARWYQGEQRLLNWVWKLLAVSIAAQLATFPLGLYYFGQFPTYFFISNLLIVPVAGFILGLGLFMLGTSLLWPTLAAGLGWLLDRLVSLVNGVVFFTESLPYSRLSGQISQWQLLLLMLLISGLLIFFQYRKFVVALSLACIGLVFMGSLIYEEYLHRRQKKLFLYHIPGNSALQLVDGKADFLITGEGFPAGMLKYHVQPNRAGMGFSEPAPARDEALFKPLIAERPGYLLLVWQGRTIVYLKEAPAGPCLPGKPLEVDYVIIADNAVRSLGQVLCYFSPGMLLIDGSNRYYLQKRLKQQAESLQIPVHLTAEEGAFEVSNGY
jgi:competence protein ComEC